jgi:hypothetical protein
MSHNISRIRKVSRLFRVFFTIWLACTPLLYISYWAFFNELPEPIRNTGLPGIITQALSVKDRCWGFLASLIPMSITIAAFWILVKLFALYEKGAIFTAANVKCFRRLGYILLLWSFLGVIYAKFIFSLFPFLSPHEHVTLALQSHEVITMFLIGGVLVLISWVMDEGRELEDEQSLII